MKRNFSGALFIILQLLTFSIYSATIELINGDRISGEIKELHEKTIKISSEILGEIAIPFDKVRTIKSEEEYVITTTDGVEYVGNINYRNGEFSLTRNRNNSKIDHSKIEKIKFEKEKLQNPKKNKWSGEIKALASFQKGTVDTSSFEGNTKINREGLRDKISAEIWGNYGEVEGNVNIRKYGGNLRYMFYPIEKLYVYGETGGERDESRKLGLRYQIGGGTGYDLIKKEKQNLSFEGALLLTYEEYLPFAPYEKEKVKQNRVSDAINRINSSVNLLSQNPQAITAYGGILSGLAILINPLNNFEKSNDDYVSAKISTNYSQKILSSTLTNILSLDTNLERVEYYRFGSKTSLSTPLHKNLSLEISLSNDYDSDYKKRGIEAWEHRLSTGIKYEFK
ncbi:MAG: DUF481 domain-containing protein [Candidatus Hydrogenedentes bacterium]|nr:DUF481 domain-containing protein [Candidatus Hydrogenedentota bacterium]